MAENNYECMVILDSNRFARDPVKASSSITKSIETLDGEVLVSRLWNEQKLAYPIRGHRKGSYWLTYFRMEAAKIDELKRACQLDENIVRSLILRIDERLIDALVAHAKGEALPSDEEDDEDGGEPTEQAGDDVSAEQPESAEAATT